MTWKAGAHEVSIALSPLPPAERPPDAPGAGFEETQRLEVRIHSVQVKGPFDKASRVPPAGYRRFFPHHLSVHGGKTALAARAFTGRLAPNAQMLFN